MLLEMIAGTRVRKLGDSSGRPTASPTFFMRACSPSPAATKMPMTSITYAPIQASSLPVDGFPTVARIYAPSRLSHAGKTSPICAR
jgi:hypothetical protein